MVSRSIGSHRHSGLGVLRGPFSKVQAGTVCHPVNRQPAVADVLVLYFQKIGLRLKELIKLMKVPSCDQVCTSSHIGKHNS